MNWFKQWRFNRQYSKMLKHLMEGGERKPVTEGEELAVKHFYGDGVNELLKIFHGYKMSQYWFTMEYLTIWAKFDNTSDSRTCAILTIDFSDFYCVRLEQFKQYRTCEGSPWVRSDERGQEQVVTPQRAMLLAIHYNKIVRNIVLKRVN